MTARPWRGGRREGPACTETGKTSYLTPAAADWTMRSIWDQPRPGKLPVRYYRCPFCSFYHLTSQNPRQEEPTPSQSA